MEESFKHKHNSKVKILKLLLKKEESKVSVNSKFLIGSVSFCKFLHKEVAFLFYSATTKLARLQIELSFLNYLKTRLVREGSTYSSNLNIFYGDLMKAQEVNMEIISAKQRRAAQTMSGEGESQLEIERRNIKDKEAKIRRAID